MFHHFVKPLMGSVAKSHKIGTFLWDKWKSTRLYLDYICLNNSLKANLNSEFQIEFVPNHHQFLFF